MNAGAPAVLNRQPGRNRRRKNQAEADAGLIETIKSARSSAQIAANGFSSSGNSTASRRAWRGTPAVRQSCAPNWSTGRHRPQPDGERNTPMQADAVDESPAKGAQIA
jgi:hypothetical protein